MLSPKIIITGPESSGKTTLCQALSKHFKIPFSKEYARQYLNVIKKKYTQTDLLIIAKTQLKSEKEAAILDTDLITIKIWSNEKYGKCDKWILEQINKQKNKNRIYLLCKPDLPWQDDPLRENPKDRMRLFEIYKKELSNLGHNYYIISKKNRDYKYLAKRLSKKFLI